MNKKLIYFYLCITLFSTSLINAQNVIWGAGSTNLASDTIGRFALPFGSAPNAWTALSVFHGNVVGCAQVTPGNSFWTRSTTGRSLGNFWSNRPAINSQTMADGVALFDSDYLCNNGTATFNSGTAPSGYNCGGTVPGQRGELQSPTIDLSGYTDSTISARFYLYYRPFTLRELSIGISTDGGATWTDFDITQGVAANADFAPAWVEVPMFGVLDGVANLTNCKLRLAFEGYYYFAMLDDLSLIVTPDYDFAISAQTAGNTLGDGFTTTYTSDYRQSPISQQDLSNYFYTARVTNNGAKPILPSNNARIEYLLEKARGAVWDSVFSGSIAVDTVLSQDRVTPDQVSFPNLNMIDTFATYRATFVATHDLPDANRANDTIRQTFTITENYFSKCRNSNNDGMVGASRPIFPSAGAGNVITEFEYGSMFYFPSGAADSVKLDSVNVRLYGPSSLVSGFNAAPYTIRVYEFRDLNGNGTLETSNSTSELILVGLGLDTAQVTASQYRARTVSIIDLNTFDKLYLKDTTVYFVTIDQRNPQGLQVGSQYRCTWLGADELNYSINAAIFADGSKPRHTAPVRIAQANSTTFVQASNDWNWVGFGADIQPSLKLVLSGNLNPFNSGGTPTGISDISVLDGDFSLFPNPTGDLINLSVNLNKSSDNLTYILTNINGQVLNMVNKAQLQNDLHQFDVKDLPSGVYFISVRTADGVNTQRFIKN